MAKPDQSADDQMAMAAAYLWKRLPADARKAVVNDLSIQDQAAVEDLIHHGRKVKHAQRRGK